jgi:hypothetical protein
VDVQALLKNKAKEDAPFDDGSGKLDVWVVQDFKLEPVPVAKHGQFYGGDSYVILYTYLKNKSTEYVLYFWLGNKSSTDEKGSAALLTKEKDDALGGRPVQVRVVQGKEPAHFRQLFKGRNIVHAGGKASGFKNSTEGDTYDTDGVALFRVKGTSPLNTQAVQVEERASSLNSDDVFVLVTPDKVFVWYGRGSTEDEQAVGNSIAEILAEDYNGSGGRSLEAVNEGSEGGDFWGPLGGQGEYAASAPGESLPKDARLFQGSDATGSFKIDEVVDFTQEDLNNEDIYILDTFTTVYVWLGGQANAHEKEKAVEFANQYVAESNDGRDPDSPVILVKAGEEPGLFTSQFVGWDAEAAKKNVFSDPYLSKLEALNKQQAALPKGSAPNSARGAAPAATAGGVSPRGGATTAAAAPAAAKPAVSGSYSFDDVKNGKVPAMDLTQKENYLDDVTFKAKFGTDKATFAALPKWKKDTKKKELGLF